jgi:hypothetical protein
MEVFTNDYTHSNPSEELKKALEPMIEPAVKGFLVTILCSFHPRLTVKKLTDNNESNIYVDNATKKP